MAFWQRDVTEVIVVEMETDDYSDAVSYALTTGSTFLHDIVLMGAHVTGDSREGRKKHVKLDMDDIWELATFQDRKVAEQLVDALDPEVLKIFVEYLLPNEGENMFDNRNPKNNLRRMFIKAEHMKPIAKLTDTYVVMAKEGVSLVDSTGDVLVTGTPQEVFCYASQYCSSDLMAVYRQLRNGRVKGVNFQMLQSMLASFRKERMVSKGSERLTKVSQLGMSDHDNPYFWFKDVPYFDEVVDTGVDWRSLTRFKKIIPYEPGDPHGILLANVIKGNEDGAKNNDWEKLDELLADGRELVALCVLDDKLRDVHGIIVHKPRPHNLACVVAFGSDFPLLDDEWEDFQDNFVKANEWRNERIYGMGNVTRNSAFGIDQYLLDLWKCKVKHAKWEEFKKRKVKMEKLSDIAMVKFYLSDQDHKFFYVKPLPGEFVLIPGLLWRSAVEGVDPLLQASMLYELAKSKGIAKFKRGNWRYKQSE